VQMEHVWVEAALDYIPSQGAVNRTPDSWENKIMDTHKLISQKLSDKRVPAT